MGCFSDIGWVVSHSYTLYGPLLTGAATVLYEGKPVGTPDPSAFWRLVEEYKINTMFTAPTALRAIRKNDPDNSHFARIGERGGLRSLRAMFLAGERSEPAIVTMYQDLLRRYGAEDANVVDNCKLHFALTFPFTALDGPRGSRDSAFAPELLSLPNLARNI